MRPFAEIAIEAKVERPFKGNSRESFVIPWARQLLGKDRTAGCDVCQQIENERTTGQYLQRILEMLVNLHDGGLVTAPVTVVGCCKKSALTTAAIGERKTYLRI